MEDSGLEDVDLENGGFEDGRLDGPEGLIVVGLRIGVGGFAIDINHRYLMLIPYHIIIKNLQETITEYKYSTNCGVRQAKVDGVPTRTSVPTKSNGKAKISKFCQLIILYQKKHPCKMSCIYEYKL